MRQLPCVRCRAVPVADVVMFCDSCLEDAAEASRLDSLQCDMNLAQMLHTVVDPFSKRLYHVGRKP